MISTEQIERYFDSLTEFEHFRLRWIRVCASINKSSRNAENIEAMEIRAEKLGI